MQAERKEDALINQSNLNASNHNLLIVLGAILSELWAGTQGRAVQTKQFDGSQNKHIVEEYVVTLKREIGHAGQDIITSYLPQTGGVVFDFDTETAVVGAQIPGVLVNDFVGVQYRSLAFSIFHVGKLILDVGDQFLVIGNVLGHLQEQAITGLVIGGRNKYLRLSNDNRIILRRGICFRTLCFATRKVVGEAFYPVRFA